LPVVLYGCETVREEQRLRVFENAMLGLRGRKYLETGGNI
jgi:hypothetical protein